MHPLTGMVKEAPTGFSWTTLFFGIFPALFRGDVKWGLIMLLLAFLSLGLSWLIFPFIYNGLYLKGLIESGYKMASVSTDGVVASFGQNEAGTGQFQIESNRGSSFSFGKLALAVIFGVPFIAGAIGAMNTDQSTAASGQVQTVSAVMAPKKVQVVKGRPQAPSTGNWYVSAKKSQIDDSEKVTLILQADEPVKTSFSKVTPLLFVRCSEAKTNVYVSWDIYLGLEQTEMLIRFDRAPAQTKTWSISTDSKAVFVRGGDVNFAKKMMHHGKLLAQITPYGESPVTAVFNIEGLKEAIKPLRRACSW